MKRLFSPLFALKLNTDHRLPSLAGLERLLADFRIPLWNQAGTPSGNCQFPGEFLASRRHMIQLAIPTGAESALLDLVQTPSVPAGLGFSLCVLPRDGRFALESWLRKSRPKTQLILSHNALVHQSRRCIMEIFHRSGSTPPTNCVP